MRKRRPWWRWLVCWTGQACPFKTNSDAQGVWGECCVCGKRVGYVTRASLRFWEGRPVESDRPDKLRR